MTRKILQNRMLCSCVLIQVFLTISGNAQQSYRPDWESLKSIPVPSWFDDAKFGIFIHWGPQAVSESNNLRLDPPEFGYKDVVPLFKAEHWDPDAWAELFREAGARYVILTGEHHDGYALWASQLTKWCATKIGPKRDLVGELARACRARGLRFAPSYHRERHNGFFATARTRFLVDARPRPEIAQEIARMPEAASLYGPFMISDAYISDYVARWQEMQRKYEPDFMWIDDIPLYYHPDADHPQAQKFNEALKGMIADYFNDAAARGQEVYLNNKGRRQPNWPLGVGCRSWDRSQFDEIGPKFQCPMTMGHSWYYRKDEDRTDSYKSTAELIHMLVDIVSKNGNLLLNIGPRADGTIPAGQRRRLLEIGEWLARNGQAIYGTRPWKTHGEGDVRFTAKGCVLYAIFLKEPSSGCTVPSTKGWQASDVKTVTLLGNDELARSVDRDGLRIRMSRNPKGKHAFVVRIECSKQVCDLPAF